VLRISPRPRITSQKSASSSATSGSILGAGVATTGAGFTTSRSTTTVGAMPSLRKSR